MNLKNFMSYKLGGTPIHHASSFCPSGNLFLKLESQNPHGSIKERAAYYMIRDLIESNRVQPQTKLVESSSGNLGLSLGRFAQDIGIDFICLVDPTLPESKINSLHEYGVKTHMVSLGRHMTFREARIHLAMRLSRTQDWIWTRQYDNPANVRAHYETTGPEIWSQLNEKIDFVICSVGSGGTICGIGQFMKEVSPTTRVIAVEPLGSTIFGGQPGPYLSVGAGMPHEPGLITQFGTVIDYFAQIDDMDSLEACRGFHQSEGFYLGVTTGSALVVGSRLAERFPNRVVVVIAPDGGENYITLFENEMYRTSATRNVKLNKFHHLRNSCSADDVEEAIDL